MKKVFKYILIVIIIIILIVFGINIYVKVTTKKQIIKLEDCLKIGEFDCIIVFGAGVWGDKPSPMLEDRLKEAISLYKNNVASKILMSGDHGTKG